MNRKECGRKWLWPNLNLPEGGEENHGTLSEVHMLAKIRTKYPPPPIITE